MFSLEGVDLRGGLWGGYTKRPVPEGHFSRRLKVAFCYGLLV